MELLKNKCSDALSGPHKSSTPAPCLTAPSLPDESSTTPQMAATASESEVAFEPGWYQQEFSGFRSIKYSTKYLKVFFLILNQRPFQNPLPSEESVLSFSSLRTQLLPQTTCWLSLPACEPNSCRET